jgi:hypothetical protein
VTQHGRVKAKFFGIVPGRCTGITSRVAVDITAQTMPDNRVMNKATDPLLITLSLLLTASVTAFSLGFIPYPYGLLVLGFFIVTRILYLKGKGK